MSGLSVDHIEFAKDKMSYLIENKYEYSFRGVFDKSITASLLRITRDKIENNPDLKKIKKKIIFIIVETLQNISRHQSQMETDIEYNPGIFIFQNMKDKIVVTTGNIIENDQVQIITNTLEELRELDEASLKEAYLEALKQGEISDRGGAGLGFLAMARKTKQNFSFDFNKINDDFSYFYFSTIIPVDSKSEQTDYSNDIGGVKNLNNFMAEQNILFNLSKSFEKEDLAILFPELKDKIKSLISCIDEKDKTELTEFSGQKNSTLFLCSPHKSNTFMSLCYELSDEEKKSLSINRINMENIDKDSLECELYKYKKEDQKEDTEFKASVFEIPSEQNNILMIQAIFDKKEAYCI